MSGRLGWVDSTRGAALLLVLIGHARTPLSLKTLIYSFHIPLFFIISGFLIKGSLKHSPKDFFIKKVKSLLIPYFFLSSILIIYNVSLHLLGLIKRAKLDDLDGLINGVFVGIRGGQYMPVTSLLWFLLALFLAEVVFYYVYKISKGDKQLLAIILAGVVIAGIVFNILVGAGHAYLWSIDTVPFAVAFLGVGYFLREGFENIEAHLSRLSRLIPILTILFLLGVTTAFINHTPIGRVDMFHSYYGNFLFYFVSSISLSIFTILVFHRLNKAVPVLNYVGKNSLVIYALQRAVFSIVYLFFLVLIDRKMPFVGSEGYIKILNALVLVGATLLLSVPIVSVFKKYVPTFIGMKDQTRSTKNK